MKKIITAWLKEAVRFFRGAPLILVALLLCTLSVWAFAEIAEEVLDQDSHSFDRAVLLSMRTPGDPSDPLGPAWVEEMGRDITALGGSTVLTIITVSVALFMILRGRRRMATLVVLAIIGASFLSKFLKQGFDRPRPELVPHGSYVYNASFPSGHSLMAAVVYLTLGALLARVQPDRRTKIYLVVLSIFITMLVGVSRVYLGVHWPTDVLAGWSIGAAWALGFWMMAYFWQHQSKMRAR